MLKINVSEQAVTALCAFQYEQVVSLEGAFYDKIILRVITLPENEHSLTVQEQFLSREQAHC